MKLDASAVALAFGAVLLWFAWALMPDAATNDAAHILTVVAAARAPVHASAILQLAGAALVVAGLAAETGEGRRARAGAVALLIGGAGMAADAVYHQLAFEMTAPDVARDAVLPVMVKMQTRDLRSLLPLLLLFPVGAVIFGAQRRRGGVGSRWTSRLLMAPAVVVPLAVVSRAALHLPARPFALAILGVICAGLVGVAVDRARAPTTA
ncbi:MAG TPA: hypothetical protein VHJ20_13480 [Polyangia bacterium]|nr:hypothetical protein [Polyangia bacterium]